jgi:hypothetical protein
MPTRASALRPFPHGGPSNGRLLATPRRIDGGEPRFQAMSGRYWLQKRDRSKLEALTVDRHRFIELLGVGGLSVKKSPASAMRPVRLAVHRN